MHRRVDEKATGNGNGNGRVKFRFADNDRYLDIEMQGGNETLADGLRTLANALSRGAIPTRALGPGKPIAPAAAGSAGEPATALGSALELEEQEPTKEGTDLHEEQESIATNVSVSDKPKRPRSAPPAPTFLSDLNLASAQVPLREFMDSKAPSDTVEKYTVIAAWLKQQFNIEEVTPDHIFTAYTHLGWESQLPNDVGHPLRFAKSQKKNWFVKGTGKGAYKLNWNGETAVNKMGIPAAKSA